MKKIHHTGIRTQTRSIVTQHATNELQRQSVRLLLRAIMNRHIYIYLHIYI